MLSRLHAMVCGKKPVDATVIYIHSGNMRQEVVPGKATHSNKVGSHPLYFAVRKLRCKPLSQSVNVQQFKVACIGP
jgi:hypothetical protein